MGTLSHARPIGNVVATLGAKLGESRQELRNKVTQTDRGEEIAHFPFCLVGQSETPENTLIVVCVVRFAAESSVASLQLSDTAKEHVSCGRLLGQHRWQRESNRVLINTRHGVWRSPRCDSFKLSHGLERVSFWSLHEFV